MALGATLCAMLAAPAATMAEETWQPVINVGGVEKEGAGSIKGIVKVEGEKRNRAPLRGLNVDAFCNQFWRGKDAPLSENYVWGDDDTLQNVVVFVSKGLEGKEIPQLSEAAKVDQIGCIYIPHILAVQAGQPVEIHNSDNTMHNVNFRSQNNGVFNDAMVKGVVLNKVFNVPELGGTFACNVHPWMTARLAVFDHPYFAVTQQDGTFEIKGLPPGEYEISTWHEVPVFKTDQPTYKVTVPEDGAGEVTITYVLPAPRGR
jgi:plastocyanin